VNAEDFAAAVERHRRWNTGTNLVYGLFGTTGLRLINAPTLVPDYVYRLGGSNGILGMTLLIGGLCRFVGPLFGTALVSHRARAKPWAIAVGVMMRIAILGIALGAFFASGTTTLVLFIACFGAFHFFDGVQSVTYNIVMGKVIPLSHRGRFIGLRDLLGGTTVALLALPIGRLLDRVPFPRSYGYTYLLAFGLTAVGLVCFGLTREPAAPWRTESRSMWGALSRIPSLLRADRSFSNYCLCRALGSAAMMATPFFILYAQASLSMNGTVLGHLTFLFFTAQTLANPVWGRLADRHGFRSVALVGGGLWMLAAAALLALPHTLALVGAVFTLVGIGQGGFRMAAANMVFEFGLDAEFAQRVATVNMIGELAAALAPLGAGFLADQTGHATVLVIALVFMAGAQAVMATGVRPTAARR
jgi:MFS family permease